MLPSGCLPPFFVVSWCAIRSNRFLAASNASSAEPTIALALEILEDGGAILIRSDANVEGAGGTPPEVEGVNNKL